MEEKITTTIQELLSDKDFLKTIKQEDGQLYISLQLITELSPELADEIQKHPNKTLLKLKEILEEKYLLKGNIRLTHIPEGVQMLIRQSRSKHVGKLVAFEGIIRQAGKVLSRVYKRALDCPSCGSNVSTFELGEELKSCRCMTCGKFMKVTAEELIDNQTLVLEESADLLDSAKQPERIHIVIEDGLVDPKLERRALPGTRILAVGILKDVELKKNATKRTRVLDVNNIIPMEEEIDTDISHEMEEKIKEMSKDPGLFNKFIDSFASSIIGNEHIKRAILLQLLGGSRRKKSDRTDTRDNIHILLIGSRSTGKSALLKNAYEVLPKARRVNGKGASGVGITASVSKDEITGQFMLEAGAIALANNSLCIIDEMDKINPESRDHLHECMEDSTITVSKAGINQTLHAKTSILAAANPRTSEFNMFDDIAHQINMPLTLISRFDCIFVMKDVAREDKDELIAEKILSEHTDDFSENEIDLDILKKYILYARRLAPKLTKDASKFIREFYTSLRKEGSSRGQQVISISTRQLEGIVRLAEAHAKFRLSEEATTEDAEVAIDVMKSWLKEVGYDKEAGMFNVNSIMEPPKSKMAQYKLIENVFSKLDKNKMYHHELEKEIPDDIISHKKLWNVLKEMKVQGMLFEPRRGLFQLIE
jgi:replicative DNA helicase Mcm